MLSVNLFSQVRDKMETHVLYYGVQLQLELYFILWFLYVAVNLVIPFQELSLVEKFRSQGGNAGLQISLDHIYTSNKYVHIHFPIYRWHLQGINLCQSTVKTLPMQ